MGDNVAEGWNKEDRIRIENILMLTDYQTLLLGINVFQGCPNLILVRWGVTIHNILV